MKLSLKPAPKPGTAPRLAAKPKLRPPQYTEEYDIAEPLIASILWGRSNEKNQASIQLHSVNSQIRAKNIRHKIPKGNGCIDIAAFKAAAEQLGQASTAFAGSKDTKLFSHAKHNLEKCIRLGNLPKSWNIEWEVFLDFHRERIGRSNTDGNQNKRVSNAQSELFEEEEDDENLEEDDDEYSGADYEEEEAEEEEAGQNGYYDDGNEYIDQVEENDDGEGGGYGGYTDKENDYGYDETDGEYSKDDSEDDDDDDSQNDRIDQGDPDHDSIDEGPEFDYNTERELDCVDVGLIRRRAQNHYGLLLTPGFILGWRKTKQAGLVTVMGYECRGKRTARVKQHKDPNEGQESVMEDRSLSISGIGLIAWEVDSKSVFEPTKSLYPTPNGTYPTTFIAVRWEGDIWTWESREDFYSLMGDLTQFEVDILLYFMAISQEGDYVKAMTGKRPTFPGIASTYGQLEGSG
ncbi:hypothetical protein LT330_010576 [Penicillium expansum]|nr:hypothetical protein LT330_010576 [Penicillium expansum]